MKGLTRELCEMSDIHALLQTSTPVTSHGISFTDVYLFEQYQSSFSHLPRLGDVRCTPQTLDERICISNDVLHLAKTNPPDQSHEGECFPIRLP